MRNSLQIRPAPVRTHAEQHGACLLLIMAAWKGDGKLPSDTGALQQISRMTPQQWAKSQAVLQRFFFVTEDFWMHNRVCTELDRAKANVEKRSKAGAIAFPKLDFHSVVSGLIERAQPQRQCWRGFRGFRQPGDLHVHFFGTATLSFADGVRTRAGDRFEISMPHFGQALVNGIEMSREDQAMQTVLSL